MSQPGKYSFYVEDKALQVADRPRQFLRAFAAVLDRTNYGVALEAWSRTANRCGRCSEECQVFAVTGEKRDHPCLRSEQLFKIFRRYFTPGGRLKGRLPGTFVLTDAFLDGMAEAAYRCTGCRRCLHSCPMGIDHGLVTHLTRWLLAEIDLIPKALLVAVREQLEGVGNTSAIPVPALLDTLEFLEEDFEDDYDTPVKFPVEVEGAEYVFFPAVSDYLLEPDTLMGGAAVFYCTGDSWTVGKGNYDGINYGLFYSDRMMERIVNNLVGEVKRLKGSKILVGECGHATKSAWFAPTFAGPEAPEVVSILDYTAKALREGRIPLKGNVIKERVTYHDPCNMGREGRIVDSPREILQAVCADFVEMTPNKDRNYCCGGGGGTVSIDEIREFRTGVSGKLKADQIRATGARYVVSPCANCKKQLGEVCEDNGLEEVEVVGVHDLLLKAIDFDAATKRRGGE